MISAIKIHEKKTERNYIKMLKMVLWSEILNDDYFFMSIFHYSANF